MATHKSAIKRARQNEKRNARNRGLRSALRTTIKAFRSMLKAKDMDKAKAQLPLVHKALDKAVTKGVIHKNTAGRNKSRLTAALNKTGAA
ncbi:MAG: 30S ribosomal protein S20 [Deltaproteobacteria bacterium]|nr:30S ribosomal protein S20 [Deltaproteobacteria bacterium]